MESLSIKKIALVLAIGVGLALVLGGIANAINLGRDGGYILGATAIALVAGVGVPWALGWKVPMLFERRQEMQAHKTAVIAYKRQYWVALPSNVFIANGLEKHRHTGVSPVFYTAGGAFTSVRPPAGQGVLKRVDVSNRHQFDPTTFHAFA